MGHENAYKSEGTPYESVLYYEEDKLRSHINNGFEDKTLILKAHGCISNSKSIVLTSSSYEKLLNDHRTYRAIMQHVLSRFTILIVGFSLRDRDFDQMLDTIEKDFGSSVQRHIAIIKQDTKAKSQDKEKVQKLHLSNHAVLESRYGLKVLPTESHQETEDLLGSLSSAPGSWIKGLAREIASDDKIIRANSRKEIGKLSDIGKRQLCDLMVSILNKGSSDLLERSEQLYSLGLLRVKDFDIVELFLSECENQAEIGIQTNDKKGNIECIAHSLVALRTFSIAGKSDLNATGARLVGNDLLDKFSLLDGWLVAQGGNPRLVNYAKSAFSEIVARSGDVSA